VLGRLTLATLTSVLTINAVQAQDGARAYYLLPQGTDVLSLSALHLHAGQTFPPGDFIEGSAVDANVLTPSYYHSIDVMGNAGALVVGIPFGRSSGELDTTGDSIEIDSGFAQGDLFVGGLFGIVGSPSLAPQDYAQYKPGFRAGVVTKLFLPTGDYDSTRLLNMGSNRWSLQASLPISYVLAETMLDPGLTTFEVVPSVQIFGDNDDAFGMANVSSQKPVFGLEGHITRNFGPTLWASLDGMYKFGGETAQDGVDQDDAQQTLSLGATLGVSLSPSFTVRLIYDELVYSSVADSTGRSFNVTSSFLF
jgi:hypothetical protein